MYPKTFKVGKAVDFLSATKAYIIKNYDASCFDRKVETFLTEVQQNRNVICNLAEVSYKLDTLRSNREILTQYINQLNWIKSKMTFGKEDYCIKIDFQWKDTWKGSKWNSFNIHFEYYSCVYNLAVMYFLLAEATVSESGGEDSKLKEAIKYYQYAAGLFDTIKNEAITQIIPKELPYDLNSNYMTFCSYICTAYAQTILVQVAEKKKSGFELQAQLCQGISSCFENALVLLNDSLKKYTDDQTKSWVANRKFYYQALMYSKMRDKAWDDFDKTGEKYGIAITYQAGVVTALGSAEKESKKIKSLISKTDMTLEKETNLGKEMYDKNKRIYNTQTPELDSMNKIDKKLMTNPTNPPDFKVDHEASNDLDALIPKEVKNMIWEYKTKMMGYITENLNIYENESTITEFLNDLGLPSSLECILSQSEISPSLWKKISEIQEKGCTTYLSTLIQQLNQKPDIIIKRITESITLLNNEDNEDKRWRSQYGSKWTRKQSPELNGNLFFTLNDYQNKLMQAKACDTATTTDIKNNLPYYELLSYDKNTLNNKIPKKVDPSAIKNCKEATSLRQDWDLLDVAKDKVMTVINKIFSCWNDDNVAPQFIQVLQKKTTENAIWEANKSKFTEMFAELQAISNEIKNWKTGIQAKNEVFLRVKKETFKPEPLNDEFFLKWDKYCQLFHQKEIQLQQGLNFYKTFEEKLSEVNRNVTDFLLSRDIEKKQLMNHMSLSNYSNPDVKYSNVNQNNNLYDFTQNKADMSAKNNLNDINNCFPLIDWSDGNSNNNNQHAFRQQKMPQEQQGNFHLKESVINPIEKNYGVYSQFGGQNVPNQQQSNPYGQAQQSNPYGQPQQSNPYGQPQQSNPYGQPQQSNPYGQQKQSNPYGQPQNSPYGQMQQSNPYGQAQQSNPYGQPQQSNPYGQPQQSNPYRQSQQSNPYGQQQNSPYGQMQQSNPYGQQQNSPYGQMQQSNPYGQPQNLNQYMNNPYQK